MPHMLSYTDASIKPFVLCVYLGVQVEARKQLRNATWKRVEVGNRSQGVGKVDYR